MADQKPPTPPTPPPPPPGGQSPLPPPLPPPPQPGLGDPYGGFPPAGGRYGDYGYGPPPPPKPQGPPFVFGEHQKNFTTTIVCPQHQNTTFDEKKFLTLLAGSISLTKTEKRRIVESIPKLSQWQIDELVRILEEEKQKFVELSPKHGDQLKKLEEQHIADWRDLEVEMKSDQRKVEDQAQADEIRRKLMGGGSGHQ